jgi:hypothetical protein
MPVYSKSILIDALLGLPFQAAAQDEAETFKAPKVVFVEFGGGSG